MNTQIVISVMLFHGIVCLMLCVYESIPTPHPHPQKLAVQTITLAQEVIRENAPLPEPEPVLEPIPEVIQKALAQNETMEPENDIPEAIQEVKEVAQETPSHESAPEPPPQKTQMPKPSDAKKPAPKKPPAKTTPKPIKKSTPRPVSKPISKPTSKPASKPAPKQVKAVAAKTPSKPQKKETLKQKSDMARSQNKAEKALLKDALSSLDRSHTLHKEQGTHSEVATASTVPSKIASLATDTLCSIQSDDVSPQEKTYIDDLITRLHLALRLPENGVVRLELTLKRDGAIAKITILSANSPKNRTYVTKTMSGIGFPPFGTHFRGAKEHTFSLCLKSHT